MTPQCGVRSAECGVRNAEPMTPQCGVRNAECGVRNAERGGVLLQCGVRNAECGVRNAERGGVLLLVLWVTVALSFVALSMALMVRTELAATGYRLESEQARFLARGALEQTLYVLQNPGLVDAEQKRLFQPGQRYLDFTYDRGRAHVTIAPESARVNVNIAGAERLRALFQAAGMDQDQASQVAEAVVDWRSGPTSDVGSIFDQFYAALPQPYRATHRRFERLEELLLVKGITPELFYGWMERDREGHLVRHAGLARLLTVYGAGGAVSLNDAPYEVLMSLPGMDAEHALAIVAGRRNGPYRTMDELPMALPLEASTYVTLWVPSDFLRLTATGQPNGSATKASVCIIVGPVQNSPQKRLLFWEEQAVAEEAFEAQ